MTRKSPCLLLLLASTILLLCPANVLCGYQLLLNDNGPVTTGATVTLTARVVDNNGKCATGVLMFHYEDDAFPRHAFDITGEQCEAIFLIPFNTTAGPSIYRYKVDVKHQLIPLIIVPIASGRGQLTVTENLNGQLLIIQNNITIPKNSVQTSYVSTSSEVVHKVELNAADFEYLKSLKSVVVYWFFDCVYKGNTTSYTYSTNYTESDSQHEILGIVVASIDTPQSHTTITTTTASPNVTISTPITTSAAPVVTAAAAAAATATTATTAKATDAAAAANTANAATADVTVTHDVAETNSSTTTALPPKTDDNFSFQIINTTYTSDCQQQKPIDLLLSTVKLENEQKYGYFSRILLVKDPITNIKTQGKVWIQEGEMLDLQVNCNGSGPFRYCVHYVTGPYNVTGNESCAWDRNLVQCQIQFFHYFREPTNYTLLIIMANDVSKIVTPIGINIYKVQKQPQISVIVVPVTFSSIAVIIIVFGIAYYFQNRSRYMVEVADFDFANNSDMEYKTFRERLRDAISQAINRTQDYSEYEGSEEQIGGLVTPQNQKYGSMQ